MDSPPLILRAFIYHRDTVVVFYVCTCYPHSILLLTVKPLVMKVTFQKPEDLIVELWVKFFDVENLWKLELHRDTPPIAPNKGYTVTVTLDGAIPGRKPEEIEYIQVGYGGTVTKVAPEIVDGAVKPFVIYDGDKDYWTNILRRKALEAPE